jgi:hypothetical protein
VNLSQSWLKHIPRYINVRSCTCSYTQVRASQNSFLGGGGRRGISSRLQLDSPGTSLEAHHPTFIYSGGVMYILAALLSCRGQGGVVPILGGE